tara:strand:- start:940 stop:1155 length:216 start_codon:yes stop_codon:yes gene_type:complete
MEVVEIVNEPSAIESTVSMWLMLTIAGFVIGGLLIFLIIFLNKSKKNKNDNLVYEDQMDEQELKKLDDEIN